jgi:hypothetical protein
MDLNGTGYFKGKGKAIPVQTWTGPEVCRNLRLKISRKSAHEVGTFVRNMYWPPLPHRK